MIQRIQTIYLLLATVALITTLFIPLGTILPENETNLFIPFTAIGVEGYRPIGYAALLILSAFVSLASIFLWKNRTLQVRICIFNMVLMLTSYLIYFIYKMSDTETIQYNLGWGNLLPFLSILLTFLAIRSIRRDEKLIRSLNRIR